MILINTGYYPIDKGYHFCIKCKVCFTWDSFQPIRKWLDENVGPIYDGWQFPEGEWDCICFEEESSMMAFKLMFPEVCEKNV